MLLKKKKKDSWDWKLEACSWKCHTICWNLAVKGEGGLKIPPKNCLFESVCLGLKRQKVHRPVSGWQYSVTASLEAGGGEEADRRRRKVVSIRWGLLRRGDWICSRSFCSSKHIPSSSVRIIWGRLSGPAPTSVWAVTVTRYSVHFSKFSKRYWELSGGMLAIWRVAVSSPSAAA